MTTIALFGLGEAGGLIGADLARLGASQLELRGYDPADVATPAGVTRAANPVQAAADADFVLAFTAAPDADTALQQALDSIPKTAVYADFASASAGQKRALAAAASGAGLRFCDVALMAMVPGNGIGTPAMLAGTGADELARLLAPLGMPIDVVSDRAGDAAERKLLRSVVIKGLAGLLIEALHGARQAQCETWLWQNLVDQFGAMDRQMLQRLVDGTGVHADRRWHEMQASAQQLSELGVEPLMTRATVSNLEKVKRDGVPEVPKI